MNCTTLKSLNNSGIRTCLSQPYLQLSLVLDPLRRKAHMGFSPHLAPLKAHWELQWRQICQVWAHTIRQGHFIIPRNPLPYLYPDVFMAHPQLFYHIVTSKASKIPTQVPSWLAVTLKFHCEKLFHTRGVVQIVFASPSSTCASCSGCGSWACCWWYGKSNCIIIAIWKGKPNFHMPKGSGLTNIYADGSISRANS